MSKKKLKIAQDYTTTPGPRYIKEGSWSGEKLRNEIVFPQVSESIKKNEKIEIDLDGTAGYGTSFLEEVFGGLIRENKLDYDELVEFIEIKSDEEPYLIEDIFEYLKDAYENPDE
ncbi:STAS-like domain-containing protein [Marivirga salinae]|uniref:STAS-like domain-containing protein n=1 Tax=Marivirga salinarum TaxID=3059078 RepID=A0AA51NB72_9BACT|nr:STAS-like domain-containing protein [Marivirga sp. BDSF4-3]WMN11923.1 STAS-like domain-containing protein [Marivirga sp. BDSF4-3]